MRRAQRRYWPNQCGFPTIKSNTKTMKKKMLTDGSEETTAPLRKLHQSLIDCRCIVQVIANGIASRNFYILSSPERIPGYKQSRNGRRLECVQRFAETNRWHVTVNNENGWFIFTAEELPLAKSFENNFGQLAKWIESSLHASN